MRIESQTASIEFKTAAFKALLQGPAVFARFSGRFAVSRGQMQEWLGDAGVNLALAKELESEMQAESAGAAQKQCSTLLVCEERKMLLGKPGA